MTTHTSGVPYSRHGDRVTWTMDEGMWGKLLVTADSRDHMVRIRGDISVSLEGKARLSAVLYKAERHAIGGIDE